MNDSQTAFHPYRPRLIQIINRFMQRRAAAPTLSAEALIHIAQQKTGLSDFGDESFREGLDVLCRSLTNEARLHPVGMAIMRFRLIGMLVSRLRLQQQLVLHPQILDEPIERPLIIAGLQRTGTTFLQRLLAADPAARALYAYEAMNPIAPQGLWSRLPDFRRLVARLSEKALKYMAPQFFAIHPVDATAPEEEVLLMEHSFMSQVPESMANVPSYAAWLATRDLTPVYRYLKSQLQLLQWQQPRRRWVLKSPVHLESLQPLLSVFPDAIIIQTHRDPTRTTGSYSSMMAHGHAVFSDQVDARAVAQHWLNRNIRMVEAGMRVREQFPRSFVDVYYRDLMQDPMPQVRRIYEFAGLPLSSAALQAIEQSRLDNRQNKHGVHRYDLATFGLTESQIQQAYAAYIEFFQIPQEKRG